jgi:hypothetical protein
MSTIAGERMRPILMGGNWKLNPQSIFDAQKLATKIFDLTTNTVETDIVLFPPFTLITEVKNAVGDAHIKVYHRSVSFRFVSLFYSSRLDWSTKYVLRRDWCLYW